MSAEDHEGRIKLAGYMIRAPMSYEEMSYDGVTGTVIYRSKMHLGVQGPMRVIALIDDPAVVRRILDHLGRWAPWPRSALIPLTYHPIPDIK